MSLNKKRPILETPSVWKRSSSSRRGRLVRVEVPNYNFNFLGLPTEIKLLICRYLSPRDILSLSYVSEDYGNFVDSTLFMRRFICLEMQDVTVTTIIDMS